MSRFSILIVLILQISTSFWCQENIIMFSLNYNKGKSFSFNTPPALNSQHKTELYFRHIGEQNANLRFDFLNTHKTGLGFSFGLSYGNVKYVQPIFHSEMAIGSYNSVFDYFEFSRNYLTVQAGLTYNKAIYDNKILLSSGVNLLFSHFANHKAIIGSDSFKGYNIFQVSSVKYNYKIAFDDKNIPLNFQIETNIKFKLNKNLYLNFGIHYLSGRKFEYEYFYNYKTFTFATETWSELTTHKNYNHLEQPRRIDHVFFINTGFSFVPNWGGNKK